MRNKKTFNNINNSFPEIKSDDRIIIFSPHPDDDILTCSKIILEAVWKNATIKIVYMTNGEGRQQNYLDEYLKSDNISDFKGNLGELRHFEALNSLNKLGLNENKIIFLGYPDSGLKDLFLYNWDYDNLFKNENFPNHSPYDFSFEKNAPYCGVNLVKNLNQILDDFKPNMILTPDCGDEHGDHWATNAFIQYITTEREYNKSIYHFLVHKEGLPIICTYAPFEDMIMPLSVIVLDDRWLKLVLSPEDEQIKKEAINSHKSQIYLKEEKDFLDSFIRTNEYLAFYPKINIQKEANYSLKDGIPKSSFRYLSFKPITMKNIFKPIKNVNSGDLDSIGLILDKESLYIIVHSNKFTMDYHYIFHLYLYERGKYRKLYVDVKGNKAKCISKSLDEISKLDKIIPDQNSITQRLEVQNENNMVRVKIPVDVIKYVKDILITAEVQYSKDYEMNITPLRVFKFV